MRARVKKWGNSASVRIPAAVMEAAALYIDQAVDIREEGGRVVIEPVTEPVYTLEELLAQITPDNLHEEIDWGPPVCKEVW